MDLRLAVNKALALAVDRLKDSNKKGVLHFFLVGRFDIVETFPCFDAQFRP